MVTTIHRNYFPHSIPELWLVLRACRQGFGWVGTRGWKWVSGTRAIWWLGPEPSSCRLCAYILYLCVQQNFFFDFDNIFHSLNFLNKQISFRFFLMNKSV